MARDDPHFRLRIPEDMRDRLKDEAERNNRSMNAEIIARLQEYEELKIQLYASENAQVQHVLREFAASQKAYSDAMAFNLNNLSRFVLEHSEEVPSELAAVARRNFDFTEAHLSTITKRESSPHKDAIGLPLFKGK